MVLAWRRDDGLLKSVKSFSCAGEGGPAGLRPAPAVVPAAGRQEPKPKPKPKRLRAVPWFGGAVSDCGHPAIRHRPAFDSSPLTVGWVLGTAWGNGMGSDPSSFGKRI
ncbi:MAG TPA: hypothetical protein DIW85_08645 [Stenotrophomonas sp.]|nr:hypothetical protein [Stenotrophomonas sp.]